MFTCIPVTVINNHINRHGTLLIEAYYFLNNDGCI